VRVAGELRQVGVEAMQPGDVAVVRTGELIPVDGVVNSDEAVVDTSTLTGEPLPVTLRRGMKVMSGTVNAGPPFDVCAARPAAESAYAALVRLVEQAERERAPFVRMGDRYAGMFLPVTVAVATAAWVASGDPVRALAVVVVATPCPLISGAEDRKRGGLGRDQPQVGASAWARQPSRGHQCQLVGGRGLGQREGTTKASRRTRPSSRSARSVLKSRASPPGHHVSVPPVAATADDEPAARRDSRSDTSAARR
jgi:hypothetical protein